MTTKVYKTTVTGKEIAVIGMCGRFPGARNIDEFWENLENGIESISFLSDKELEEAGVDAELITHPDYVKAKGLLQEKEYFDAAFFGYTPLEAEIMNPQIRIFHECAWEALENAGYEPELYDGLIGLYAGASSSSQWEVLVQLSGKMDDLGKYTASNLADKDFINSRISYNLNLKGPVFFVHTACSTSLVAIHLACRGLLTGEFKMVLAGGITIAASPKRGYLYQKGMILSPDGHSRAFDKKANGTVGGEGAGLVVLKRLKNAIDDGDHIYAVIKGSAINNDGKRKVGFTAPSVGAQAEVIRTAQRIARVEPGTISYIETHGTGTTLGDPVEIEALTLAFDTDKKRYCTIGSVKTNLGHLDAAAGVAGFIKTVLSLKHKLIPPSLHFEIPNPGIDFENSPFYVNRVLKEWENNGGPLRAGVSSLGMGGTNAHVILEEAPGFTPQITEDRRKKRHELILLSAKTETALDNFTVNLVEHFKKHPEINLSDAAYTLQVGRRVFEYKRMLVCSTVDEAVRMLSTPGSRKLKTFFSTSDRVPVIFMFSGLGAQYVNMGLELYQREPQFREEMDRGFAVLKPLLGFDIKDILYPGDADSNGDNINRPEISQPLIFVFEYALAKLLIKWGIHPQTMIGYSLGEYVAACIAGVFSLEDALKLIVNRGKLIMELPEGLMTSVPLPREELELFMKDELSISIDNGPSCIVSGPPGAVEAFEKRMKDRKYMCMRLQHASHAIHSPMMDPILKKFEEKVSEILLNKPQIPYISNVTGGWITAEEVTHPGYWSKHLKQTVNFSDGLEKLVEELNTVFVEIGPGHDLSALITRYTKDNLNHQVISLIRHPKKEISDVYFLLNQIGRLWLFGKRVNWHEFYRGEKRHRISLPIYPFERQKYWIEGDPFKIGAGKLQGKSPGEKKAGIEDWFYIPQWKRSTLIPGDHFEQLEQSRWLIFITEGSLDSQLVKQLARVTGDVITVSVGPVFSKINENEYTVNPGIVNDYKALFKELNRTERLPDQILSLWSVTDVTVNEYKRSAKKPVEKNPDPVFYHLVYMAKAIGENRFSHKIQITVITDHIHEVTGEEILYTGKAAILGPLKVIPQEYPYIVCRSIDIIVPAPGTREEKKLITRLLEEFTNPSFGTTIAYRNSYRWMQTFEPVHLGKIEGNIPKLRRNGVYLITGGPGKIGSLLAEYLVRSVQARLVLIGRTNLPPRHEWEQWLGVHGTEEPVSRKILRVKELEKLGGKVLVFGVDISNEEQMKLVISRSEENFGSINGVIHAAADTGASLVSPIDQLRESECLQQFRPKVDGLLVLEKVLKNKSLDFCFLTSSLSPILGGLGFTAYAAANAFMDAFVYNVNRESPFHWITVNWADWQMKPEKTNDTPMEIGGDDLAVKPEEGVETFRRILYHCNVNQVVVSSWDLQSRLDKWVKLESLHEEKNLNKTDCITAFKRPHLLSPYAAPSTELEEKLVDIWKHLFGFEMVGVNDDFFELGGDSLKAVVIISKLHKELKIDIPITEFFNYLTIETLAGYIKNSTRKTTYSSIEPIEESEYYVLSPAQKRLYILQQMDLEGTTYNERTIVWLEGQLDKKKLQMAFKKLIHRHEIYRTSIKLVNDEFFQQVHPFNEVEFSIDYFECSEEETAETVRGFRKPLDLGLAPVLRVGVVKVQEARHLLMVETHHITSDGISLEILVKELITLYEEKELPPLKIQYKDYSKWQNDIIKTGELEKQEKFWLEKFEGEIPVLNLPTDYPRPVIKSLEGKMMKFEIGKKETHALKKMASNEGTTLFMVTFAVYCVFLSKMSGQEDIVVGVPAAGRRHSDLENILGIFINTLAIRCFPRRKNTFRKFLHELRTGTLQAFENQDFQFDDLVEKIGFQRNPGRNPLFDVVLNFMNNEEQLLSLLQPGASGLNVKQYEYKRKIATHDLTLYPIDAGEKMFFSLEYCTKLFNEETIEAFIRYFKEIVTIVIDNIEVKLEDINVSHNLIKSDSEILQEDLEDFAL